MILWCGVAPTCGLVHQLCMHCVYVQKIEIYKLDYNRWHQLTSGKIQSQFSVWHLSVQQKLVILEGDLKNKRTLRTTFRCVAFFILAIFIFQTRSYLTTLHGLKHSLSLLRGSFSPSLPALVSLVTSSPSSFYQPRQSTRHSTIFFCCSLYLTW